MAQSEFKNEASPLPDSVSNTLNYGQQIPTTKLTRRAKRKHKAACDGDSLIGLVLRYRNDPAGMALTKLTMCISPVLAYLIWCSIDVP